MKPEQRRYTRRRIAALTKVSSDLQCVKCGCDVVACLEINHINGQGNLDRIIHGSGDHFFRAITSGRRHTNDLNIMCRPCNSIDYMQRKTGRKLPIHVIWGDRN